MRNNVGKMWKFSNKLNRSIFKIYLIINIFVLVCAQNEEDENAQDEPDNKSYTYQYGIQSHGTGDVKSLKEARDGDVVHGEYTVNDPDGFLRTVKYTVDKEKGFQATVTRTKIENFHPPSLSPENPQEDYKFRPSYPKIRQEPIRTVQFTSKRRPDINEIIIPLKEPQTNKIVSYIQEKYNDNDARIKYHNEAALDALYNLKNNEEYVEYIPKYNYYGEENVGHQNDEVTSFANQNTYRNENANSYVNVKENYNGIKDQNSSKFLKINDHNLKNVQNAVSSVEVIRKDKPKVRKQVQKPIDSAKLKYPFEVMKSPTKLKSFPSEKFGSSENQKIRVMNLPFDPKKFKPKNVPHMVEYFEQTPKIKNVSDLKNRLEKEFSNDLEINRKRIKNIRISPTPPIPTENPQTESPGTIFPEFTTPKLESVVKEITENSDFLNETKNLKELPMIHQDELEIDHERNMQQIKMEEMLRNSVPLYNLLDVNPRKYYHRRNGLRRWARRNDMEMSPSNSNFRIAVF